MHRVGHNSKSKHRDELRRAMALLAENPSTLFVGQAVRYPGQAAYPTFADVPMSRRIELPVAEDMQAGFCMGLALEGYIPLCFYPRWDFALLAANQIVNHLDKALYLGFPDARVIIRTAIGWRKPHDQGPQHRQNYSAAFAMMCETINVVELDSASEIVPAYERALWAERSSILVERIPLYGG